MNFDEYSSRALKTADYPDFGRNLLYPALGLAGEAGEVADKVKKFWRNNGITAGAQLSAEQILALKKEVGDVLWYINAIGFELRTPLECLATLNIEKLEDRVARGVVRSEGDNR